VRIFIVVYIVNYWINALPCNSSLNAVQHAIIGEAIFSIDPIDVPVDLLNSNHVIFLLHVHVRSTTI
jgi:uncharacterized protein YkvS